MKKNGLHQYYFLGVLALTSQLLGASPVCCTYTQGNKIINEQYFSDADAVKMCRKHTTSLIHPNRHFLKSTLGICAPSLLVEYFSDVEVCYAPTSFAEVAPRPLGNLLDLTTERLTIQHSWIRTPHFEMGQGARKGIPIVTEWTDHHGKGLEPQSQCFPVAGCSTECVESHMRERKFTGLYGALNTCHDLVVRVFNDCGCYDTCLNPSPHSAPACTAWTFPPLGHADRLGLLPH